MSESNLTEKKLPILYSFRRCPYAMRARIALILSAKKCYLREVVLKQKPDELRQVSPKATVPVLVLPNDHVLDESLDIMYWALSTAAENQTERTSFLISECDQKFKYHLDRYKYPSRYEDVDPVFHRHQGRIFLSLLEQHLRQQPYLSGLERNIADISIFPFVRQFALTDRDWFDALPLPNMHKWFRAHLAWDVFEICMRRYVPWSSEQGEGIVFPSE